LDNYIGVGGTFKIPLAFGGPWGLHVYSEKYIYFPLQIQINPGVDNDIPVILPVDGTAADDPKISNIRFKKLSDQVFQIAVLMSKNFSKRKIRRRGLRLAEPTARRGYAMFDYKRCIGNGQV